MNKWPQLLMSGQKVTVEQAKEIILLTDRFFCADGSGNNHSWIQEKYKLLGIESICFESQIKASGDAYRDYIQYNLCTFKKWACWI